MLTISARDSAPFHHEIDEGPDQAYALWRRASDGVRVRVGIWPASGIARGTVLLFPGRTEFIEKYGHVAAGLFSPWSVGDCH